MLALAGFFLLEYVACSYGIPEPPLQEDLPEELVAKISGIIDKKFERASDTTRATIRARVLAVFRTHNKQTENIAAALGILDSLIGSVTGTAAYYERVLGIWASDDPLATKKIPDEFFQAEHIMAIELVEKTLQTGFLEPLPLVLERNLLQAQISELVTQWSAAATTVFYGDKAQALIDTLAKSKREELESQIGQRFIGLIKPLSPLEMQEMRNRILSMAQSSDERIEVRDERPIRALLDSDPVPEDLKDTVRTMIGIKNKLGNTLHEMWNYSHPDLAPILLRNREHIARLQEFVGEIRRREHPDIDLTHDPAFSSDKLPGRPASRRVARPIEKDPKVPPPDSSMTKEPRQKKVDQRQQIPPSTSRLWVFMGILLTIITIALVYFRRRHGSL